MAGVRATSGATIIGVTTLILNGEWTSVEVVNWGTVVVFAKAAAFAAPSPAPTVSGDDCIPIPIGASVIIPVDGAMYDQGGIQGGSGAPTVQVSVAAGTAASGFSVVGAGTP